MTRIRQIRKRDGRVVPFQREKIADAVFRAARSVGGEDRFLAEELAGLVVAHLERRDRRRIPTIEEVQDLVETVLIETGHARTAKAYILYRHRRAAARAARAAGLTGARPVLGGQGGEEPYPLEKAHLVEALVAVDDVDRGEAEDVARHVEERILASPLPRLSDDLLAALVKAEMFARGRASRFGEEAMASVPRDRIRAWLARGPEGARAADPATFAELLGEDLLRAYVLEDVVSPAAGEALRVGDLHALDLGAPFRLAATALPLGTLLAAHLEGDLVGRGAGPRLLASTLGSVLDRYRPYVARGLTLEHVNVHLAPFLSHLEGEALLEEIRQILLLPAVGAFPARGGRLELEWTLAAEVPPALARREPPPPAPPGPPYGAYADTAREIARALVRETRDLKRRGRTDGPRLTLVVPRAPNPDAALRALLREALLSAGETGDPLVVFAGDDDGLRGGRWLRRRARDAGDPLRLAGGDVTVATVTAVNAVAAALRTREGGVEALLAELERLATLAVQVAATRRDLLARAGEAPGCQLYAIARGPVPLVDLDAALHLVCPVGLARAARLLGPAADPAALRAQVLERWSALLAREGGARGLQAAAAPVPGGEAERRFARLDALRYGEAAAWWPRHAVPTYAEADPRPGEARHEPVGPLSRAPAFHRVRHRVAAEDGPRVDDLLAAVEVAAEDEHCEEYAVEPWPRRWLNRGASDG